MPVRLARPDETPLLPLIEHSSDQVYRSTDLAWVADAAPPPASQYRALVEAATVWVSTDGDTPVAFVACAADTDGASIVQLATALEHQQKGHGSALMRTAIAWARQSHPRFMLTTARDIPWNAPYYRRFGFEDAPDLSPSLVRMLAYEAEQGYDPATRVGMVLTLTP